MKRLFGGRYSVRNVEKRKKNQRSVMSYEDVPLDEYNDKQPEISKEAVKRILIVVAIIAILAGVVGVGVAGLIRTANNADAAVKGSSNALSEQISNGESSLSVFSFGN